LDETAKNHDVSSGEEAAKPADTSTSSTSPVAPASKPAPTQAKAAEPAKNSPDPKEEARKLARERIRAELSPLGDKVLLRFWNELSELKDITISQLVEMVLKLPTIDTDNAKDQAKRDAIIALFKKETEALKEVPLKEFQKVANELVFERFFKDKNDPKNKGVTGNDDKNKAAQDQAKKAAEEAIAKAAKDAKDANDKNAAAAAKTPDAKALEDLAKAKENESKGLGDALRQALGQADQGGQGQGQGQGSGGAGDSGSGSGSGSDSGGGGDSGSGDSKSLADNSSKNKEKKKNDSASSNNFPSLAENSNKSAAPEKKENKFQFPESSKDKEEPKKSATPAASDVVQSDTGIDPKVTEAGSSPPKTARVARSLGEGKVGSVIPGGQSVQDAGFNSGGGDSGGAKIANGSQAPSSSGGGGDFFQKTNGGTAYATPPTTTGYNMIKTGPNDWQASDGGGGGEGGYGGSEVADDGDSSYKRRGTMQASAGLVGLPGNTSPNSYSGNGDTIVRSFSSPEGVFKRKLEWSGGGLCQGLNQNLIGVCQKSSRQPASTGANRI